MKYLIVLGFVFGAGLCQAADDAASEAKKTAKKNDKNATIELESYIVGDKEQPAVSYFIPWQGTGTPDKLHWNIERKNDRTLDTVDRDVLTRSMNIYNEMKLEPKKGAK